MKQSALKRLQKNQNQTYQRSLSRKIRNICPHSQVTKPALKNIRLKIKRSSETSVIRCAKVYSKK